MIALCQQYNIKVAILKARSPSCGAKQVYDGSHNRKLIDGMGLTAQLLTDHGIIVFDEMQIDEALDRAAPILLNGAVPTTKFGGYSNEQKFLACRHL